MLNDGMLSRLLEGAGATGSNDNNFQSEINPAIEGAVNAWEGSPTMLAESISADIQSSILMAYETFELATLMGAAQVVKEGTGAEGALAVMENAFTDFFAKIGEKLKEIGSWIASIFRRIFKKTKEKAESKAVSTAVEYLEDKKTGADGKKASEKIEEIKQTAKSDPSPEKKQAAQNLLSKAIPVQYKAGQSVADKVMSSADKMTQNYESQVKNISKFSNADSMEKAAGVKNGTAEDYYKEWSKDHLGKELESLDKIKLELKRTWKVDKLSEKKGSEITIANIGEVQAYLKWYGNEFKAGSICQKAVDRIEKSCNEAAKAFDDLAKHSNKPVENPTGDTSKLYSAKSAFARKCVTAYNSLSAYTTAVLSEHISIATSVHSMYVSFANRLKGGSSENVNEGMDFETFLECEELGFDVTEESFDDDFGGSVGGNEPSGSTTSAFESYISALV